MDWRDEASQRLRFEQLLGIVDSPPGTFSLTDFGCGYGALVTFLEERAIDCEYRGFDVSEPLLRHAESLHGGPGRTFVSEDAALAPTDYVVASGVFNVKQDSDSEEWTGYVVETLRRLDELAERGFSFNLLTNYSEPEKMRSDLYYGDPWFYFDLCKREFSRHVALLHDYDLWEFTLLVRRRPRP